MSIDEGAQIATLAVPLGADVALGSGPPATLVLRSDRDFAPAPAPRQGR